MSSKLGDVLVYNHVHFYVDSLKSLEYYKSLEHDSNTFSQAYEAAGRPGVEKGKEIWKEKCKTSLLDAKEFEPAGQDFVEQLIIGGGWRVTGRHSCQESTSLLVASHDPKGVKFVVSASKRAEVEEEKKAHSEEKKGHSSHSAAAIPHHFRAREIDRFFNAHANKPGVAALGFEVTVEGTLEKILKQYKKLHPALLTDPSGTPHKYPVAEGGGSVLVGEVFAYYSKHDHTKPDLGTCIRFFEIQGEAESALLPGLCPVKAEYPVTNHPAYYDHWVSNVHHREQFLQTLEDVLGFTPKVDFNAGVVAAGEAIIESTVTGNHSNPLTSKQQALQSHRQVYLPINNALSSVGHVHLFLDQLGQGIQHIASRVSNVVRFVALVNETRQITGRGLSFLRIPRSYYGRLDTQDLVCIGICEKLSGGLLNALIRLRMCSPTGVVKLDITRQQVLDVLTGVRKEVKSEEGDDTHIVDVVMRARYSNLYKLLKEHLSEKTYLDIVRNQVLVDIQGQDILFQIFTCNVLQREAKDESPFLEFIQRVCSERKDRHGNALFIRPGCGGFGIRNFLTLFLSIEVSKAMAQMDSAIKRNDVVGRDIAERRVQILTAQLDESNPILTEISDAMTAESDAMASASLAASPKDKEQLLRKAQIFREKKLEGNRKLQELSECYKLKMKEVREEEEKARKK